MRFIDLAKLEAAPLQREPYDHVVVPGFVGGLHAAALDSDFPAIDRPGSFPLASVGASGAFAELAEELCADAFRQAIERKFEIDLAHAATMLTARGWCRSEDGKVHTDSKSKIITVLLYLNPEPWQPFGGRLRLLKADDKEALATEVRPDFGTLLVFRRSDQSWHGHLPYEGPRRILQMNWVTSEGVAAWEQFRHALSARVKHFT
jgi:hypothetical protein